MRTCKDTHVKTNLTTVKGERVLLRPLQESDLEESLRVWTPELRHMYGGSLVSKVRPTMEGRRQWFDRVQRGEEGRVFAIEADGRYIGHATIEVGDEQNKRARYRIGIEDPAYWGRGYGSEVTCLMSRYAFEILDLHRVDLRVGAYNTRAVRCYEKCGFRHEGVERDSFFVDDQWHDDLLMAILRQDWEELNPSPFQGEGRVRVEVNGADPHPSRQVGTTSPYEGEEVPAAPRIRAFALADYEQVAALWQAAGLGPRPSDTRDEVAKKLRRDPDLFLVACIGARIVGTVIGGWDGRRGWVYRMAVHPEYQRRGIGTALMRELETRFRDKRALAVNLIYSRENVAAVAFYRSLGYHGRDTEGIFGKDLRPEE